MLKQHPVVSFIVLSFAISWSVVLFAAATTGVEGWEMVGMAAMIFVGQFGPTLASLIVVRSQLGKSGVRAFLRSTVGFKQAPGLLAFALLFYPVLFAVAVGVAVMLSMRTFAVCWLSKSSVMVPLVPSSAVLLLMGLTVIPELSSSVLLRLTSEVNPS